MTDPVREAEKRLQAALTPGGGVNLGEMTVHEFRVILQALTDLRAENEHLDFICDFYYEALGPANDDIADMAEDAWRNKLTEEAADGRT